MNTMGILARRAFALLLMMGLIYAVALVVRGAMASFTAVPALQLMQGWDQKRLAAQSEAAVAELSLSTDEVPPPAQSEEFSSTVPEEPFSPNEEEWQTAYEALQRALRLEPGDPALHANLGRLYQYKFEDNNLPLEEIGDSAKQALVAFDQAARLRPTWPYHWWDIARTEYVLQRSQTPEFRQALDNCVRFGPWLPDVQLFAADLALEHWDTLGGDSLQLAVANIDRALVRSPGITPGIVASYDAWDPLCEQVEQATDLPLQQLPAYCANPELREPGFPAAEELASPAVEAVVPEDGVAR